MRISILGPTLAAALLASGAAAYAAPSGCSEDTFLVKGTQLSVELCAPSASARAASKGPISIAETITAKGQPPLARKVPLDGALGDETSHTIDDAPLQSLGIAGTLHMTLAYKSGAVRLEHALLVPGAIALK